MGAAHRVVVDSPNDDDFASQHLAGLDAATRMHQSIGFDTEQLIVDLSDVNWVEAPLIIPISCVVNEYRGLGFEIEIDPPSEERARTYLDTIRFPEGVTDPHTLISSYLPICRLDPTSRTDALEVAGDKIRELISRTVEDGTRNAVDSIFLPISETIDNVDQHSEFDQAAVMAQFFPTKEYVDICISDNGISISGSYDKYDVDYSNHEEAIEMAVEQGISTKQDPIDGRKRGTGLRTVRRLVCDGLDGEVIVSSNNCSIYYSGSTKDVYNYSQWMGTTIAARLYPPDKEFDLYEYVE